MTVEVLAFGIVKEIFGKSVISIEMPGTTVAALKQALEASFPKMKQIASYMVAVNNEYAKDEVILAGKDEIAVIPPVSGG
ncbi:molybdopterin converting factor subunit 1 [Panacibacter sp. DH6]|uniref:Molybdopterin synthase sulfur carrier subunit n=1 Tax=Panacibacter microcysteis TaxID=2793269 RepID=A0A931E251_9BACT|nr:molybdopterin converting factor subunit 1 [Panacibacter microcysteis]MBG9377167.1 molybdopterin converting factor subunit 1 [Panacibacter microcysteis]